MKNIVAFSASNSNHSINRALLAIACESICGQRIINVDIRDYPMPIYSIDLQNNDGFPDTTLALKELFASADAFVIATPEHNGSMPAVFKNTIDWLSRMATKEAPIFGNKPVLLLSTSPGPNGGATNIKTLIQLMPWWGAKVAHHYSLGRFQEHVNENTLAPQEQLRLENIIDQFIQSV